MEKEDNEFFGEDDEVFDENSGMISGEIANVRGTSAFKENVAHLQQIPEEDNSFHEPTLVEALQSCQGDFQFSESGEEDETVENDKKMKMDSPIVSSAVARDATLIEISKIGCIRNNDSTLRHISQSANSKPCKAFSYKNLEQTYFDENLATSSFKFGDAALSLINKDGEMLRQMQALRLPSQTSFNSPSGGLGFGLDLAVDCSTSLGGASQKSKSKSEPKQGVLSGIEDKAVPSSSFSLPGKESAPTFLLDTSKGSHSPPLLDVDKPCMYFGFRQFNYESTDVLNLNGLVDAGIIIRCRLKPLKNEAFRILYKADTKQKIRAFGTHSVYISFCPKKAARYRATLHIDCLSQKNESAEYTCQLLGFGGQAMVNPFLCPVIKSRRDLVMSAGGRFNMIPKSINKFSFLLENKGTRDAFASVILQDVNGDEIPTENAFVQPANLLLDKSSQSSKKIEVRTFVQNAVGSRRNSFTSNASSRISSAVNNTTGSALPTAFRILILWGEERQRQRLKMLERRKREKFFFLNRHFTVTRYEGEQVAWDDATDELLSKEDYRMFEGYLRVTVIEVLDKRYSRYLHEIKSRPASATGNTVIELEPDNTNNYGRDSILSSIPE